MSRATTAAAAAAAATEARERENQLRRDDGADSSDVDSDDCHSSSDCSAVTAVTGRLEPARRVVRVFKVYVCNMLCNTYVSCVYAFSIIEYIESVRDDPKCLNIPI